MTLSFRAVGAAILLAGIAASSVACAAAAPEAAPTPTATAATPTPSTPAPTPDAQPTEEPIPDPTCDNLIPAETVAAFDELGWTARADIMYVGSTELADGIQCLWGDFTTVSDHVQIFGWAPITDAEARAAQDELVASGWVREVTDGGVIITESPETAVATDDEGYGFTYLFGDGWVKSADTKQSLILVAWPPA